MKASAIKSYIYPQKSSGMKDYLIQIITKALQKFEGLEQLPEIQIEQPRIPEHGDVSTNIAMLLARPLKMAPRKIAEATGYQPRIQ